jgi:hypothetical protein
MALSKEELDTSYNYQAVLSKEQFILPNEVITEPSNHKALSVIVAADVGYSSYNNYENLDKRHKIGYVPDQNFRKGNARDKPYHQDHFTYNSQKDVFLCPEGKPLILYKILREERSYRKFQVKIYKAHDCPFCSKKLLCTRQRYRTIAIEDRKTLLLKMRKRLKTKIGREKYL